MKPFYLFFASVCGLWALPAAHAQLQNLPPHTAQQGEPAAKPGSTQNYSEIARLIGYPAEAAKAGIQGKVVIRVLVDERGDYVKHKVIESPSHILTQACEVYIHKLRFTPVIERGKPIKFWVNMPFMFKLE